MLINDKKILSGSPKSIAHCSTVLPYVTSFSDVVKSVSKFTDDKVDLKTLDKMLTWGGSPPEVKFQKISKADADAWDPNTIEFVMADVFANGKAFILNPSLFDACEDSKSASGMAMLYNILPQSAITICVLWGIVLMSRLENGKLAPPIAKGFSKFVKTCINSGACV